MTAPDPILSTHAERDVAANFRESNLQAQSTKAFAVAGGFTVRASNYLLHGAGDYESTWVEIGRMNLILDNLIAEGRAEPMVVVMPNGHCLPYDRNVRDDLYGRLSSPNNDALLRDVLEHLIPYIESKYRVRVSSNDRAVAGLSMGGCQAGFLGLDKGRPFGSVGAFSATMPLEGEIKESVGAVGAQHRGGSRTPAFWIAIGRDDDLLKQNLRIAKLMKMIGVPHQFHLTNGAHSWTVWRRHLPDFVSWLGASRLFPAPRDPATQKRLAS